VACIHEKTGIRRNKIIRKRPSEYHGSDEADDLYCGGSADFWVRAFLLGMSHDCYRTTLRRTTALCVPRFTTTVLLLLFSLAGHGRAQETLSPAAQERLAEGVEELKAGNLEAAERVFSEALRQGVKHTLVFHNLGVIAQMQGHNQEAATRFREALALQPNYGPARLLLGSSLLALGKNAEAVRELKEAATLLPEQPQTHQQLAKAFEATGNWTGAVQEWQRLVELAPQEPEYLYQSGRAWTKLSEWSYQEIIRLNRNSARLRQGLGQDYAIQGKYDLALTAYRQAAKADPKLPEIHLAMALILAELKRYDEALGEIELELKLVPESKAAADSKAKIEAAKAAEAP
jgi:tetratricopeptide (TPR) repeat protein